MSASGIRRVALAQLELEPVSRQHCSGALRPFDQPCFACGRRIEAQLQQLRGIIDAIQVDVADHQIRKAVVLDERIARARHLDVGGGARPQQSAGELGLARAEHPAQRDHVAGPDQSGKALAELPGRLPIGQREDEPCHHRVSAVRPRSHGSNRHSSASAVAPAVCCRQGCARPIFRAQAHAGGLVLIEAALDQADQRDHRRLGLTAARADLQLRAERRGEHHQTHDRDAAHHHVVLDHLDIRGELLGDLDEFGRRARMQSAPVHDGDAGAEGLVPSHRRRRLGARSARSLARCAPIDVEQRARDVDVLAARFLSADDGLFEAFGLAHARQLDQHRQIDPGDDLHATLVHDRDRQIRGRAAKHVGQENHARAVVDGLDRRHDVAPPLLDVVVGPDRDRLDVALSADHMLGCRHELLGEPTVSDQYQTDHGLLHKSGRLPIDVRVGVGRVAMPHDHRPARLAQTRGERLGDDDRAVPPAGATECDGQIAPALALVRRQEGHQQVFQALEEQRVARIGLDIGAHRRVLPVLGTELVDVVGIGEKPDVEHYVRLAGQAAAIGEGQHRYRQAALDDGGEIAGDQPAQVAGRQLRGINDQVGVLAQARHDLTLEGDAVGDLAHLAWDGSSLRFNIDWHSKECQF